MEIVRSEDERKAFEAGWHAHAETRVGTMFDAWERYCSEPPRIGDVVKLKDNCIDERLEHGGKKGTGIVRNTFDDGCVSVEWSNGWRVRMHPGFLDRVLEHELGRR